VQNVEIDHDLSELMSYIIGHFCTTGKL